MKINIIKVPATKPTIVPIADLNAPSGCLFASNSKLKAPIKGPIIIPQKLNTIIPTLSPRKAPMIPYLLALYLFHLASELKNQLSLPVALIQRRQLP